MQPNPIMIKFDSDKTNGFLDKAQVLLPKFPGVDEVFGLQIIDFLFGVKEVEEIEKEDMKYVKDKVNQGWWALGFEKLEKPHEYYYPRHISSRISESIYGKYKHTIWDDFMQLVERDEEREKTNFDILDRIFSLKLEREVFNENSNSSVDIQEIFYELDLVERRKLCAAIFANLLKKTVRLEWCFREYQDMFSIDLQKSRNNILMCHNTYPVEPLLSICHVQNPIRSIIRPLNLEGKYLVTEPTVLQKNERIICNTLKEAKWQAWRLANPSRTRSWVVCLLERFSWWWFRLTTPWNLSP